MRHRKHTRNKHYSSLLTCFWQRIRFNLFLLFLRLSLLLFKLNSNFHRKRAYNHTRLLAYNAQRTTAGSSIARFDTDSFKISVDNCASRCLANNNAYFEDLRPLSSLDHNHVGGINGGVEVVAMGTFVFDIEDDNGTLHTIKIPNSALVPQLKMCLLSPQHWAQEANDHYPHPRGTRMENDDRCCVLLWNQAQYRKTIPFCGHTNTPVFRTAPSINSYRAFVADFESTMFCCSATEQHVSQMPIVHIIPEDDVDLVGDEHLNLPTNLPIVEHEGDIASDDETILTSNVHTHDAPDAPTIASPSATRVGALTFDPEPPRQDEEQSEFVATDEQAEFICWHYRLGHLPFAKLKQLAKLGEIPRKFAKATTPKCAGCIYGAMTKVPWRASQQQKSQIFVATRPGECISVDQMISTQVGFVAQLKGKLTLRRYRAATIFVDHFSRLRYVHLMQTLTSEETYAAKLAFERFAKQHGVTVQHYHADNGRFADNMFINACEQQRQQLTFCGVNAHFQNGIAERSIRDLTESARKQLLHARQRWSAAVHLALWPYALRSASYLHNNLPVLDDGTSRLEKFSGIRVGTRLRDFHAFACPVFALQNALASGNTLPRWSPRARLGLNLGPSPSHARNVNLVLSLTTGLVSPQYHCNFDDFFETTTHGMSDAPSSGIWQQLAGLTRATQVPTIEQTLTSPARARSTTQPTTAPTDIAVSSDDSNVIASEFVFDPADDLSVSEESHVEEQLIPVHENTTPASGGISTRGRQRVLSRTMQQSIAQKDFYGNRGMHYMAASATDSSLNYLADDDAFHDWHLDLQERMTDPVAFHAEMMGDIMYLHQALRQTDASEFVKAVVKEVNGHVENHNWELVRRDQVPADIEVIPSVWALRRKRNLVTNEITKYKARLNLHGGKQVYGINYYETYAPVVTWFAIRLLLVIVIILNLASKQIDFVMAYPQAPIEMDMYMELPTGIETKFGNSRDYVLKLIRNLYGQKQAGRVWNEYLVEKLRSIGFTQSLIDECVFYRDDVIFIVYVDDGIFVGSSEVQLANIVTELGNIGLNVEDQGHPADYVGVNIKQFANGSIEFSQRALIDSIIKDANLNDAKVKPVPAKVSIQLHGFKNEPPFDLDFNYRSIVGKLNYLAQTTRPDIAYATHQIAKYSADPRKSHGDAILYLVRYLKKTRDLGLKFKPDPTKGFECYCDADFSGNWNHDFAATDPSTAKSRSGWAIFYANCPIIWASKLQSQVALSTTEAEYIAMSMALRDVIPIMSLVQEMRERDFKVICTEPYVYCKVFEDNSGALELARLPKLRPRTKHINVCYHHFREHVRKGLIKIFPVSTEDQVADIFTKALSQNLFQRHRRFFCGH